MTSHEPIPQEGVVRVLHVDDEPSQLKFVKLFIEKSDATIHIESVTSPKEAIRRLQEHSFDCVVSDYMMPAMDGIELARRIRETSNIPFIIYTGRGSEEVAEKAFAVGVDDYLRKEYSPSHYEVLARRIRAAVAEQRAVEALIRSEERYRTLLEQLPDPITVRIGDKRVYATKRAAEFLGYDNISDLLIEGGADIVAPDDWPFIKERMESREKGEELPSLYETKIRKADGSTIDAEIQTVNIDYQGTPAIMNIMRDITERKQIDAELRARARDMVRHDIRGPLQTIINANYLMEKNPDSFDEMRALINSSVKHVNEIMDDWKSRGIDERLTLSDTDIRALIEETFDISLIPSEVKVSQNVVPRVLHLDRIKTRRVLDNLFRNAVEAMPEGGALSIEGKVDGDDYVLEVKDTGIGISRDGLSKLFTPFYTTEPDGMGLGLAFCKRAVEAHGGTITVESDVGEGTTFTIKLPLNPELGKGEKGA